MDAHAHYLEAERLLRMADDLTPHTGDREVPLTQAAQAHALLALTAVVALNDPAEGMPFEDYDMWRKLVSVTAAIPRETDDEEDEPEDIGLHVGDVSPADPDEVGPWLRMLPLGTILGDVNGDPGKISTGFETVYQAPDREFPALLVSGTPLELTKGCNDVLGLIECCAPFRVLALPPQDRE